MRRIIGLLPLVGLLMFPGAAQLEALAQADPDPQVDAILAAMTPAERVGQLFIVNAYGPDVSPDSEIATLITDYHIGGVVLLRQNDVFAADEDAPGQLYRLTSSLQRLNAGLELLPPDSGEETQTPASPVTSASPGYVPLFIGVEHEGSGATHTHVLSGLTPMPSNMALGATWNPAHAEAVGQIVGQELGAMGVNLLLGPPADVVEIPQPSAAGDLGSRAFGGEPYWVSEMTAAYVRGVHEGSEGRVAVVPRHFPGSGGADRLASVEIPTVRRSRDQLTQFDLRPFFAVTGNARDTLSVAEGLLVGHIRYQGFQGDNLRATTRPISFDAVALQSLMSLAPIGEWRAAGGLLISDSLGLRGVRRFYDPQEVVFPARRVALDAFGAGNDILYLGDFAASPNATQMATVTDTISYFVQRYEDDSAFRDQVDRAARRIIRAKLNLYGQFSQEGVIPPEDGLAALGSQREQTFEVARNALTLLFPDQAELLVSPQRGETITIFTDTRTVRQCSACPERPLIPVDALRSTLLRHYGPSAVGLISFGDMYAFSFEELDSYMRLGPQPPAEGEDTPPEPDLLPFALSTSEWVVFVMIDVNPDVPASDVVKRFLAGPPVSPDAHIVVLAMGAPYYLDSTEVSKLAAYYALYGHAEPFIDVAARALFQEVSPAGASPISVNAIDYDILRATSPDPGQVISLTYAVEGAEVAETATPGMAQLPQQGDTLRLTTGVIVDWNGNPVPDGTPVEFAQNYMNEGLRSTQTFTFDGVAQANVLLDRPGELRITVSSGEALNSEVLRLVVSETGSAEIAVLPPDIVPTITPTPTVTPEPQPTESVEPTVTSFPPEESTGTRARVGFGDLFLAVVGLTVIGALIFVIGFTRRDLNYGLLMALPALVVGLLAYNYYALHLPGALMWHGWVGQSLGASTAAWLGGVFGLGAAKLLVYTWNRWIVIALRNRQRR